MVVKVESGDGIVAFGPLRFFLNRDCASLFVEVNYTVTFRIVDVISEYRRAPMEFGERLMQAITPVEDVVAKNERDRIGADERLGDQKGLRDAFGPRLFAIFHRYAPGSTVT